MTYALLMWDFNGVVANDERVVKQALIDTLAVHGYKMTMDFALENLVGVSNEDANRIIFEACGYRPTKKFWDESRARVRAMFDQAARETTAEKPNPFLMPGVAEVIDSIGTKEQCIVSNNNEQMLKHCLRKLGLWHTFRAITYWPGNGLKGKPFPDLLLHAAQKANVSPSRCLMIEDGLPGVRAAVSAGMTAWGLVQGDHCRHNREACEQQLRDAGASEVFYSVADIGNKLGLNARVPAPVIHKIGAEAAIL